MPEAFDNIDVAALLRRESGATIARIRPGDSDELRAALIRESGLLDDAAERLLRMPEPSDSDALGRRFVESCGLDILGRIAAMLIDRDDMSAFDPERIIEALEMSSEHFLDGYVLKMLDGIAANLRGGFYATDSRGEA